MAKNIVNLLKNQAVKTSEKCEIIVPGHSTSNNACNAQWKPFPLKAFKQSFKALSDL